MKFWDRFLQRLAFVVLMGIMICFVWWLYYATVVTDRNTSHIKNECITATQSTKRCDDLFWEMRRCVTWSSLPKCRRVFRPIWRNR